MVSVVKQRAIKKAMPSTNQMVACFGVASSLAFVTHGSADVVDLTYNGGQASAVNPFSSSVSAAPVTQDIDQIPGSLDFAQWNDMFGGTGRTFAIFSTMAPPGILSLRRAYFGQLLDPMTFAGLGAGTGTEFDGTGSAFIGFRTFLGDVGWFRMEFSTGGDVTYFEGQLGTRQSNVFVGGESVLIGDVNCDKSIDLLDVQPFVEILLSGLYEAKADINSDNEVDLLDVAPLVDLISGS